jgi:hypothetical protein
MQNHFPICSTEYVKQKYENMLNMQNVQNNMYKICDEYAIADSKQNMQIMRITLLKICYKYAENMLNIC